MLASWAFLIPSTILSTHSVVFVIKGFRAFVMTSPNMVLRLSILSAKFFIVWAEVLSNSPLYSASCPFTTLRASPLLSCSVVRVFSSGISSASSPAVPPRVLANWFIAPSRVCPVALDKRTAVSRSFFTSLSLLPSCKNFAVRLEISVPVARVVLAIAEIYWFSPL